MWHAPIPDNQTLVDSPVLRPKLLQWVARDIGDAFPGIDRRPGVSGEEPCIAGTRIPVWLLEQARRLGATDVTLLQSYPTLRAVDLANAWAYARAHASEINAQIEDNERD